MDFQLIFMTVVALIMKSHGFKEVGDKRKNVLLLIVDDLRPQIGFYGSSRSLPSTDVPRMHTPHIDNLCSRSAVFKGAHSQQTLCGPSRSSFLTGRRPSSTGVFWNNDIYFRERGGKDFVTLPGFFKQNDYFTVGMGKVFHPHGNESDLSFNEFFRLNTSVWTPSGVDWMAVDDYDREGKGSLPDELLRDQALLILNEIAADDKKQPFFMAVGFFKPHLPWIFPEKYLELYPLESIDIPKNKYVPNDMPEIAWYPRNQLTKAKTLKERGLNLTVFNSTLPDDLVQKYRRAYYSCVSFTDDLIGNVLKTLNDLKLDDNTVVVLMSDHGYSLGENAAWTKNTQFELASNVPLVFHVPGNLFVITHLKRRGDYVLPLVFHVPGNLFVFTHLKRQSDYVLSCICLSVCLSLCLCIVYQDITRIDNCIPL